MSKSKKTDEQPSELQSTLTTVPYGELLTDRNRWAFRNDGDYSADSKSISNLAESIRLESLQVALIGIQMDDGVMLVEGHRRHAAIGKLIDEGTLKPDYPVKIEVYPTGTKPLDIAKRIGSVNVARENWGDHGIIRYARTLTDLGAEKGVICRILRKSDKQVGRYLKLGGCEWLMDLVHDNCIGATAASNLLDAADSTEKESMLQNVLKMWAAAERKRIKDDNNDRLANGKKAIIGDKLHPKKYITKALMAKWKNGLSTGEWKSSNLQWAAVVDVDPVSKRRKVLVTPFSQDVETFGLDDANEMYVRACAFVESLEPVIMDINAREQAVQSHTGGGGGSTRAVDRLKALGVRVKEEPKKQDGEADPDMSRPAERKMVDMSDTAELPIVNEDEGDADDELDDIGGRADDDDPEDFRIDEQGDE